MWFIPICPQELWLSPVNLSEYADDSFNGFYEISVYKFYII